jgi:hypothetical protein
MPQKLLFIALLIFSTQVHAQAKKPVTWSYTVKKVSEKEYDLVFKAEIKKGLHMYSQYISAGGPIPTSFNFTKNENYKLVDSVIEKTKPIKVHDKMFEMQLIYFVKKAEFVQRIKIKPGLKSVSGSLEYMTCDATKCFPPTKLDFVFQLP